MNLRKYAAPVEASKKEYAFEVFRFFLWKGQILMGVT